MAHDIKKKHPMEEQNPQERVKNFDEVPFGYDIDTAVAEAERCLDCKKAPCRQGCPVEVNIPAFIMSIKDRKFEESIAAMKADNSLPAICGRVCPQESQCESFCVRAKKGEPVGIGRLERFIADWQLKEGVEDPKLPEPTGKKVAVVGAGPAGLTCAGDLAKLGHDVTMYEAFHTPGGVLVYGIPEFRLPKEIVAKEVDYIQRLGVKLETNMVIGKTITVDELFEEHGFDAVFIGTGAGLPTFLGIPGENLLGVYSANEFLTRTNLMKAYRFPEFDTPIHVGKNVAVVGAGNVAMDSARTALRLGAENVYIVYRRSDKEMPARLEEIHHAEEEGVQFRLLTNPIGINGDDKGWVKGMECMQMRLCEPDESGRCRPEPIEDSNFVLDVDTVVVAVGQTPNPLVPQTTTGLKTGRKGTIDADEFGKTSREGVWAGGDIVTGAATVINAMGAGKMAAKNIDEYLKSK
ncbi:NADPH-dependent glutamate synthase [Dethiobacter alkaliphilus]|uniref:Glutamate synthase (NADPH), homotetrameric n=1 Tax=Dethiobacter alkaliphilus AHT 1 TaxID=555088 RepID=C0GE29_DETAL|nr:NADPH-dependent glutamate synthase [Dethiobacter alkaliphilus]EEG78323.1 glutamate synthase (NADPH), homotetrameric [Dethiobacter alkaliphilus AHT 1]